MLLCRHAFFKSRAIQINPKKRPKNKRQTRTAPTTKRAKKNEQKNHRTKPQKIPTTTTKNHTKPNSLSALKALLGLGFPHFHFSILCINSYLKKNNFFVFCTQKFTLNF